MKAPRVRQEVQTTEGFVDKLIRATPSWSFGAIGALLTLALMLKVIGIDFAAPINVVAQSYAEAIRQSELGRVSFDAATEQMHGLVEAQRKTLNEAVKEFGVSLSKFEDKVKSLEDRLAAADTRQSKGEQKLADIAQRLTENENAAQTSETLIEDIKSELAKNNASVVQAYAANVQKLNDIDARLKETEYRATTNKATIQEITRRADDTDERINKLEALGQLRSTNGIPVK